MSTVTVSRPSLSTIMNRHGTDKLWAHHYEGEYARHFEPIRDLPIRLLEIGVGGYGLPNRGGEGLLTWRDYFPFANVIGIDVEYKSFLDGDRIQTVVCDQGDEGALLELNEHWGPFDVIIDDGSHRQDDVLISFRTLFPCLNAGGIYAIEDMATAYSGDYGGNPAPLVCVDVARPTIFSELADLIDGLHWRHWKGRVPTDLQRMVKSVHVSEELAFVYKR